MADRFTYLPSVGIFIIVTWGACELLAGARLSKTVVGVAMAVIIAACALRTRDQLCYWQNSETLFRHAIAVTGNNAFAYYNQSLLFNSRLLK